MTASPYVHALALGSKSENLLEIYWADGRTIFKHELDPTDKQKICQNKSYERKNPSAYYNPQRQFEDRGTKLLSRLKLYSSHKTSISNMEKGIE